MSVGVGFRCHSGWACVVVVRAERGGFVVLDRQRLDLIRPDLPRQPYHAVAEEGASPGVIAEVATAARERAAAVISATDGVRVVAVVAADRALPAQLEQILASHARLHAAEGALYEQAVIDAANDVGVAVHTVAPTRIVVRDDIERLGRELGAPWQKDHKWATAATLAALTAAVPG